MVLFETKKRLRKKKGKQRHSYDSNNSDSSNDEESWRSGMSGAEQTHILVSAGINPNDSNIEFDSSDKKRYRMLKYMAAECIIRPMSYYDNRQRSLN